MSGFVFYRGPSVLDGAPIVGIATLSSSNIKTGPKGKGNMVQTWILRADMSPIDASKAGDDAAICGACPHRHSLGGACYVNIGQAPLGIYRAFRRGAYPDHSDIDIGEALAGRGVRLGAYGDPAAIPLAAWRQLLRGAKMWTGYTHQWRRFPSLKSVCMASCDDEADRVEARRRGWRTFTVIPVDADHAPGDVQCPASEESGRKTTCANCRLCAGAPSDRYKPVRSVSIHAHGKARKRVQALTIGATS